MNRTGDSDFLASMALASRLRADEARARQDLQALKAQALATSPPVPLRLDASGFDLIAEIKLHSPAEGVLAEASASSIAERARDYARAGAAAVSVLTEPSRFDGRLSHLREAAAALRGSACTVMRKDFLVDPFQVYEARAAGAGGVLLIVRMLDDDMLDQMMEAAAHCGLFVLLEAFDEIDLARARALPERWQTGSPQLLVGLNTRDLRTLEVDTGRLARCRPHFPPRHPAVAESGIADVEDVAGVARLGYSLALVGSALMRSDNPAMLVTQMLRMGRAEVQPPAAPW
jgi:indole-3-glycerol phosphate synthase